MKSNIADEKWIYSTSLIGFRLVQGIGWCWTMDNVPVEITAILHEIEKALEAKLYYLAIAVSLSVPDICACLECDPDKRIWAKEEKYVAWCNTNIGTRFANLQGSDIYRMRGGVLHQGHFDHPKSRFDRVMFIGPDSRIKGHDVIITVAPGVELSGISAEELRVSGRLLQLEVVQFCNIIMNAARAWSIAKADDPNIKRNLPNLIRYRPEGLPPFSVGVPTIA